MRLMHKFGYVCILGLCLLHIACASHSVTPADKEQLVNRAHALWDAKVQRQWETFYDLTTSEYRSHVSKDQFLKSTFLTIESFEIQNVEIAPAGDTAKVRVAFKMLRDGYEFSPKIRDTWIRENGQWYYQPPTLAAGN